MVNQQQTNCLSIIEPEVLLLTIFLNCGREPFRKAFIESYPSFIDYLRNSVPQITCGEELLCMLIFLKQSTDDISAILGVSRKSVNQSRYRLRSKIGLEAHLTLEDFVNRLFPNQS